MLSNTAVMLPSAALQPMCMLTRSQVQAVHTYVRREHTQVDTLDAASGVHVGVAPLSRPLCKGTSCMQAYSLTLMHIDK